MSYCLVFKHPLSKQDQLKLLPQHQPGPFLQSEE